MTPSQKFLKSTNLDKFELPLFDEAEMDIILNKVKDVKDKAIEITSMLRDTDPVVASQGYAKYKETESYFEESFKELYHNYDIENEIILGPSLNTIQCNLWLSENEYDFILKILRDEIKYTTDNIGIGRKLRDSFMARSAIKALEEGFTYEFKLEDRFNGKKLIAQDSVNLQSFKISEFEMTNLYKLLDTWSNQNGIKGFNHPKFDVFCNILERIVLISRVYTALKDRIVTVSSSNNLVSVNDYISEMQTAKSGYVMLNNVKEEESDLFEGMTDAVVEATSEPTAESTQPKKAKKASKVKESV